MFRTIRNAGGERLDYTFTPGLETRRDLVVLGHGVTANKDRPSLLAVSEGLASVGIASLRMSFSGNGDSEGSFEACSVTKEVGDLGSVLDATADWTVIYCGHSMGGAVGVLRTAADRRIRALVSLAGMVHVHNFMIHHFARLQPGKDGMFDKPECPLTQAFLDDAESIGSVVDQGALIHVPWLLVHGSTDDIVPLQDSLDICDAADWRPDLTELADLDHSFTDNEAVMAAAVVPWIEKTLAAIAKAPS